MDLIDLGWTAAFDERFAPHRAEGLSPARVCLERESGYAVLGPDGELAAQLSGRLRQEAARRADLPALGDWVAVAPRPAEGAATIHAVLPRRSRFSRKVAGGRTEEQVVAANLDVVFLVSGLDGDFNLRRIERYLTLVWDSGAEPVVVLNKADLCGDVDGAVAEAESVAPGAAVIAVSALAGVGLGGIRDRLGRGRTAAFVGSSGVGKSALVNALLGESRQRTGAVRAGDDRGRHTTTMREMFLAPGGGLIVDTPGMRELQLWADEEDLGRTFREIEEASRRCRFRDCRHEGEPGCGVRAGIESGAIAEARFESFARLRRELESLERREAAKRRIVERRARTRRPEAEWGEDE